MKWRELLCRFRGHRDKVMTPRGISSYPMVECQRCHRVGWVAS